MRNTTGGGERIIQKGAARFLFLRGLISLSILAVALTLRYWRWKRRTRRTYSWSDSAQSRVPPQPSYSETFSSPRMYDNYQNSRTQSEWNWLLTPATLLLTQCSPWYSVSARYTLLTRCTSGG